MYRWFVEHVSSPVLAKRDGLSNFSRKLKSLEDTQYWAMDKLLDYQFKKLKKLLIHAYDNTSFYRKRFDDAGFNPNKLRDFNELKKLPTLSKTEIRDNLDTLIARNMNSKDLHSSETGGTTGVKMKFYRDNNCLSPKEAALYRFEKWTGWKIGERVGIIWPAQQDYVGYWTLKSRIKNALYRRQIVFPAVIADEESINTYVKLLQVKKPTMIRAFTTPVHEVASFIKSNGIDNIRLKGVITTGEPLHSHQRKMISEAFNCQVFDSLRTREAGPVAQECEAHCGLHINAESLYVESITSDIMEDKDTGELVITDLLNYGMPLIRYRTGDVGVLSNDKCTCGRSLPILKNISGRMSDVLFTPDGKRVMSSSLVLYLVDEAPGLLGQVQVVQDKLDHLTIKMTKEPPPSDEIMEYQKQSIRNIFGEKMKLSFEFVDTIPSESSGKYRFTINKLKESELEK